MAENFLQRWARRKAEYKNGDARPEEEGHAHAQASASHSAELKPEEGAAPLPTLEDVAHLTRDSDYSRFVSKGIDKSVRRAALKKLFSDPHFKVMDGLDIYIDDYNKPSPVSAAMLAAFSHTQALFEAVAKEEAKRKEKQDLSVGERNGGMPSGADRNAAAEDNAEPAQPDERNEDAPEKTRLPSPQAPEHVDNDDGLPAAPGRS